MPVDWGPVSTGAPALIKEFSPINGINPWPMRRVFPPGMALIS
jgi:hypothetical protein